MGDIRYQFRPLESWTGPATPPGQRKESLFKAGYDATIDLLLAEAARLGAKLVVIQADIPERYIRTDGLPYANAKYGSHPGVAVSFESRFGPLRYATDAYTDWRSNLRAVALSLEALRAVDRYGVSKRGEQYLGWRALEAGGRVTFPSADEALRWMRDRCGNGNAAAAPNSLYRKLASRFHPDVPGSDADEWDRLQAARLLLAEAGML